MLCVVFYLLCPKISDTHERTDTLFDHTKSGTIIRDWVDSRSMVSYRTTNSNVAFTLVTEGASIAPIIYTEIDTVFDFEIYNDTVYFCGVRNKIGVWGYFDITTFPYTTLFYLDMPLLSRAVKLEVTNMAGSTHVVMVGKKNHRRRRSR